MFHSAELDQTWVLGSVQHYTEGKCLAGGWQAADDLQSSASSRVSWASSGVSEVDTPLLFHFNMFSSLTQCLFPEKTRCTTTASEQEMSRELCNTLTRVVIPAVYTCLLLLEPSLRNRAQSVRTQARTKGLPGHYTISFRLLRVEFQHKSTDILYTLLLIRLFVFLVVMIPKLLFDTFTKC